MASTSTAASEFRQKSVQEVAMYLLSNDIPLDTCDVMEGR